MAIPAYVVAYAYTDFFQFSGPFQNFIRTTWGLEGRVFPEIRSLGGAMVVFTLALYPYVYLLARTALSERASHLMEAARLLGAPLHRRILKVALPLARPAIAAGVALALMETLADFGVSSYFGIQTFTAGIYKAWLSMDNRMAAAQLATVLLVVVALLLKLERGAQQRLRFAVARGGRAGAADALPTQLSGRQALAALEYAEANWDKLQPAAAEYKTLTETEREAELNEGVNSPEWKGGYVKHSWARDDVGAGAESVGPAVQSMQRALSGLSKGSARTDSILKQLGLDPAQLRTMDVQTQFATIAKALGQISDPAQQTVAATLLRAGAVNLATRVRTYSRFNKAVV
jgi:ABC-type molybdate transport system permease subunit